MLGHARGVVSHGKIRIWDHHHKMLWLGEESFLESRKRNSKCFNRVGTDPDDSQLSQQRLQKDSPAEKAHTLGGEERFLSGGPWTGPLTLPGLVTAGPVGPRFYTGPSGTFSSLPLPVSTSSNFLGPFTGFGRGFL